MRVCPLGHALQETSYSYKKLACDHPNCGKAIPRGHSHLTCPTCDYDECLVEHVLAPAGGPADNRRSCNSTSEAPQEAAPKPPPTQEERIAALEAENARLQSKVRTMAASGPRMERTKKKREDAKAAPLGQDGRVAHVAARSSPKQIQTKRCKFLQKC